MKGKVCPCFLRMAVALAFLLLWAGCKKELEEIHPKIETLPPVATSATSVVFKGKVSVKGKPPVLDQGFVYGPVPMVELPHGYTVSLGANVAPGEFEKEMTNLTLHPNQMSKLYVRAYLQNEQGTVYGEPKEITLLPVQVTRVVPVSGRIGEKLTIHGRNFSSEIRDISVMFDHLPAEVLEAEPTKVVVKVPEALATSSYHIQFAEIILSMGGQKISALPNFKIRPTYRDFSPKAGSFGTTIYIEGDNLRANNAYQILFNGQPEGHGSGMAITGVPPTVRSELLNLAIVDDEGDTTALPGVFRILPPSISYMNPTIGYAGMEVEIRGYNFNRYEHNQVKLGNRDCPSSMWSVDVNQNLIFKVPDDMPPGTYSVSVFTGVHTAMAPQQFTVVTPVINSFSPSSSKEGTEVIIKGIGYDSYKILHKVLFGQAEAHITFYTPNQLHVVVPAGLPAGPVKVSLRVYGKTYEAEQDFVILK